jgi:hypothetical protein
VTSLIQCTSVWFAGSKFGLSWKAKQIRMDKVPESIRGYAFLDDDDVPARPATKTPQAAAPVNKFAALQQEEEEEAEEDEAFSAPVPQKQSVLTAMMPKAPAGPSHPATAPAPTVDDEAEDHEPIPVPKAKTVTTVKKVVAKAGVKKA